MLLGEIPGLALDRTGVALLGAIVLVATERVTPAAAWAAVDVPTLALLFGLMVVSAQFRLGGFYTWVTRRIVSAPLGPSALLARDRGRRGGPLRRPRQRHRLPRDGAAARRGLRAAAARPRCPSCWPSPAPSNVGSAATLIGNPQNMLIGQTLQLSFAGLPRRRAGALRRSASRWCGGSSTCRCAGAGRPRTPRAGGRGPARFDRWQTAKGLLVLAALVAGLPLHAGAARGAGARAPRPCC